MTEAMPAGRIVNQPRLMQAARNMEATDFLERSIKEYCQILSWWAAKADLFEKPSYSVNFAYFRTLNSLVGRNNEKPSCRESLVDWIL